MSGSISFQGALNIPTKKHSGGGPFAARVPCYIETGVGLHVALVAPASAHLHVVNPVRRSARSITLAMTMTTSLFCVNDYSLFCKFCYRCMDDRIIYMCKSMGFCTEECRDEYFLDYSYRVTKAMEAESRRTRSKAREAPVAEGEAAIGYRRIFFTCAEAESFPEA